MKQIEVYQGITLRVHDRNDFGIESGANLTDHVPYSIAAHILGAAIMSKMSSDGALFEEEGPQQEGL